MTGAFGGPGTSARPAANVQQEEPAQDDDLREFMLVLRRALLMVVDWIERRYNLRRK